MKLSAWLANQLRDRGWSTRDAEKQTGISKSEISDLINERIKPGLALMVKLARGFETRLWAVMEMAGYDSGVNGALYEQGERIASLLQTRPDLAPVLDRLPLLTAEDVDVFVAYMEARIQGR